MDIVLDYRGAYWITALSDTQIIKLRDEYEKLVKRQNLKYWAGWPENHKQLKLAEYKALQYEVKRRGL